MHAGIDSDERWEDGTATLSRPAFDAWLRQRLERREPAAAVRFGDAEGRLLIAECGDAESVAETILKLRRESGLSISPEAVFEIKALVEWAFDEADVLGIRFVPAFRDEHKRWMNRLFEIYAERVASGRPPALLAHCLLGHDVAAAPSPLLAGRRASVISCRDVKPVLEAEWGLRDVAVYQVPSQHMTRDVDGAYEAAMHDTAIWPDVHARIRSELAVRERGEVFLVGAGLFGKDLCIRIREQGGIALDMGSALDELAGKITRGPGRRMLELHATGMPLAQIPARLQRAHRGQVDAATASKLAGPIVAKTMAAARADVAAWRQRPLANGYASVYCDSLPVAVGENGSRERSCQLAFGEAADGHGEPLGIWWGQSADPEFWLGVLNDLRRRGVREVGTVCAEDPHPLSEPVRAAFPGADLQAAGQPRGPSTAVRRAIETHGAFDGEQAASVLIYLALRREERRAS